MLRSSIAGVCMLLAANVAFAGDWPNCRGSNRDAHSQDTGLLKEWPKEGPKLLWSADGIGGDNSEPVVAGGVIYVLGIFDDRLYIRSNDYLYCIGAK